MRNSEQDRNYNDVLSIRGILGPKAWAIVLGVMALACSPESSSEEDQFNSTTSVSEPDTAEKIPQPPEPADDPSRSEDDTGKEAVDQAPVSKDENYTETFEWNDIVVSEDLFDLIDRAVNHPCNQYFERAIYLSNGLAKAESEMRAQFERETRSKKRNATQEDHDTTLFRWLVKNRKGPRSIPGIDRSSLNLTAEQVRIAFLRLQPYEQLIIFNEEIHSWRDDYYNEYWSEPEISELVYVESEYWKQAMVELKAIAKQECSILTTQRGNTHVISYGIEHFSTTDNRYFSSIPNSIDFFDKKAYSSVVRRMRAELLTDEGCRRQNGRIEDEKKWQKGMQTRYEIMSNFWEGKQYFLDGGGHLVNYSQIEADINQRITELKPETIVRGYRKAKSLDVGHFAGNPKLIAKLSEPEKLREEIIGWAMIEKITFLAETTVYGEVDIRNWMDENFPKNEPNDKSWRESFSAVLLEKGLNGITEKAKPSFNYDNLREAIEWLYKKPYKDHPNWYLPRALRMLLM